MPCLSCPSADLSMGAILLSPRGEGGVDAGFDPGNFPGCLLSSYSDGRSAGSTSVVLPADEKGAVLSTSVYCRSNVGRIPRNPLGFSTSVAFEKKTSPYHFLVCESQPQHARIKIVINESEVLLICKSSQHKTGTAVQSSAQTRICALSAVLYKGG